MSDLQLTSNPKRIRYVVNSYWACAWYRMYSPGVALKRLGHDVILGEELTPDRVQDCDILVMQSRGVAQAEAIQYAHSLGKIVVFDIDDDLWNLTPDNAAYPTWNRPGALHGLSQALGMADVVTTTTDVLARQLRRHSDNVVILPNMLPEEHWRIERELHPERIVVGWAGSSQRQRDLADLVSVVPTILDSYPNVELWLTGEEHAEMFKPSDRIKVLEGVRVDHYPELLRSFDIGLAPLREDKFNAAKSDLKFLEYGMLGIPTIAQKFTPYEQSIVQGENGFLARNAKDWLKYMRRLVEDAELRRTIGERAKAFAETRTIERNIGLWEKAYGLTR